MNIYKQIFTRTIVIKPNKRGKQNVYPKKPTISPMSSCASISSMKFNFPRVIDPYSVEWTHAKQK